MKTPPAIFYAISYLAAIMIGIDCAVNAWVYLSNFTLLPIFGSIYFIVPVALAGLTLNFILYKKDFPQEAFNLYKSITELFSKKSESTTSSQISDWISEIVALSSAIIMFGFTMQSYSVLAIPHISTNIILPYLLSGAYAIGTYGLLRKSVDLGDFTEQTKWLKKQNIFTVIATLILVSFLLFATWYTIAAFQQGAVSYFTSLGMPLHLSSSISSAMSCFIWVGESFFVLGVSIGIAKKILKNENANKVNYAILITLIMLSLLNAIGNGAITATGSQGWLLIISGGLLSLFSMLNTSIEMSQQKTVTNISEENGIKYAIYVVGILLAAWAFVEFIQPAIFSNFHVNSLFYYLALTNIILVVGLTIFSLEAIYSNISYSFKSSAIPSGIPNLPSPQTDEKHTNTQEKTTKKTTDYLIKP